MAWRRWPARTDTPRSRAEARCTPRPIRALAAHRERLRRHARRERVASPPRAPEPTRAPRAGRATATARRAPRRALGPAPRRPAPAHPVARRVPRRLERARNARRPRAPPDPRRARGAAAEGAAREPGRVVCPVPGDLARGQGPFARRARSRAGGPAPRRVRGRGDAALRALRRPGPDPAGPARVRDPAGPARRQGRGAEPLAGAGPHRGAVLFRG